MEYEIKGGQLPVVVCHLQKDEKVFTESGGMCWMDDGLSLIHICTILFHLATHLLTIHR